MKTDARTTDFQVRRSSPDDSSTTDFQVRRSSPDGAISGHDDPRLPASLAPCTTVFQDRRIGPADSCTTDFQVRRSSPDGPDSGHDDPRLAAAIDDYLKACEAGQPPDLEAFINQHAEIAAELRQCLAGLTFLQHAAPNIESSSAGIVNILNAVPFPPSEHAVGALPDNSALRTPHSELTLGDFRILREIGRGGMGVVYEAEQISLGRRVALKVLPFATMLDQRQLQRFKNEARAAASLDHPNIVEVHAVGCERGVHFYAMRYVEGQTLAAVIETLRDQRSGVRGQDSEPAYPQAGDDSVGNGLRAVPEAPQRAEFSPSDNSVPCTPYSVPAGNFALDSAELVASRTPHSELADLNPEPRTLNPSDTLAAALSTLRTENPRDFYRTIAELGIQAAEALDHAHQLGIVHRDIKPSNLMIECSHLNRSYLAPRDAAFPSPGTGRRQVGRGQGEGILTTDHRPLTTPHLYITDFGLARIQADAATGLTMTGDLLGTLRYMSPEQAEGKSAVLDHRSDIYSLGVTLYELLTLRPPFEAEDRQTLLRAILEDEPVAPRRLNKQIPPDLETIVLNCIAKEPTDRYRSASELSVDLQRFLEQKPIRAQRPSWRHRTWRWSCRHKLGVTAGVVLAVVAVALAFFVWSQRITEIQKLRQSLREQLVAVRSAAEAGDLALAETKAGDALRQFAGDERAVDDLKLELASVRAKLGARIEDAREFQRFLDLANERTVEDFMFSGSGKADLLFNSARLRGLQQALAIYRVLGDLNWTDKSAELALNTVTGFYDAEFMQAQSKYQVETALNWTDELSNTSLNAEQRKDVREIAYRLLLLLADHSMRWRVDHRTNWPMHPRQSAPQNLAYLEIAASFHTPTRALYWLRHKCHQAARNAVAAAADKRNMQETRATLPLDFFLPAWDAGWHAQRGDIAEELHAALLREPANYPLHSHLARDVASFYTERARNLGAAGKYQQAIADCDKALELDPQSSAAYVMRGRLRFPSADSQEKHKAIADIQQAIALDPRSASARATQAMFCSKDDSPCRNLTRAVEHAQQAISLSPTTSMCWTALGEAYFKLNGFGTTDLAAAIEAAERADELGPTGDNYFLLAMAHWKRGDKETAWKYYEQAIRWMQMKEPHNRDLVLWRRDADALGIKAE